MALQKETPMPLRAADDFAVIGAKYKELTAVPERKRSGSSAAGGHCDHCPCDPNEYCGATCKDEGKKAGVIYDG
jgi:hypothetical protein